MLSEEVKTKQLRGYNIVNFGGQPEYHKFQEQSREILYQRKLENRKIKQNSNVNQARERVSKEKYLNDLRSQRLGRTCNQSTEQLFDLGYKYPDNANRIMNSESNKVDQNNLLNSMSANYNFTNNTQNDKKTEKQLRKGDEFIAYKKKSIAEFCDLTRLNCPNFNPIHQNLLKQNQQVFHKQKEYCVDRCENAKLYGLKKPFRTYKYANN